MGRDGAGGNVAEPVFQNLQGTLYLVSTGRVTTETAPPLAVVSEVKSVSCGELGEGAVTFGMGLLRGPS